MSSPAKGIPYSDCPCASEHYILETACGISPNFPTSVQLRTKVN